MKYTFTVLEHDELEGRFGPFECECYDTIRCVEAATRYLWRLKRYEVINSAYPLTLVLYNEKNIECGRCEVDLELKPLFNVIELEGTYGDVS